MMSHSTQMVINKMWSWIIPVFFGIIQKLRKYYDSNHNMMSFLQQQAMFYTEDNNIHNVQFFTRVLSLVVRNVNLITVPSALDKLQRAALRINPRTKRK